MQRRLQLPVKMENDRKVGIMRLVKKLLKPHRYNEKGFTLIELLIISAVIGILAAVVVPSVGIFLTTNNIAAANTEAANVKTAALSYLSNTGGFPPTSDDLSGATADYLSDMPDGTYVFDTDSYWVTDATPGEGYTSNLTWDITSQMWER